MNFDTHTWNKENENECIYIANRAEAFIWLHNEASLWYTKLSTALTITIVIGNFLFGSTGITTLFTNNWSATRYINLVLQVFVIIIGIIGVVHKALSFNEKILKCNLASFHYSSLFITIKRELNKDIKDRTNFTVFYDKISSEEIDLKNNVINIPDHIFKKYYLKLGISALKYEDLLVEHVSNKDITIFELDKYV